MLKTSFINPEPLQMAVAAIYYHRDPETGKVRMLAHKRGKNYEEKGYFGIGLYGGEKNDLPRGSDIVARHNGEILERAAQEADLETLVRESIEEMGIAADSDQANFIRSTVTQDRIKLLHQEILTPKNPDWWPSVNNVYACELNGEEFDKLHEIAQDPDTTEVDSPKVVYLDELPQKIEEANFQQGETFASMPYEAVAIMKLAHLFSKAPELPYTGQVFRGNTDNMGFVDRKELDTSDTALTALFESAACYPLFHHGSRLIEVADRDQEIICKPVGQESLPPVTVQKGKLILSTMEFDAAGNLLPTTDRYVPASGGEQWGPQDLEKKGYSKISPGDDYDGVYRLEFNAGAFVLPYAVQEPSILLNRFGEGAHQYLEPGDSIKVTFTEDRKPKIVGIPAAVFATSDTVLERPNLGVT